MGILSLHSQPFVASLLLKTINTDWIPIRASMSQEQSRCLVSCGLLLLKNGILTWSLKLHIRMSAGSCKPWLLTTELEHYFPITNVIFVSFVVHWSLELTQTYIVGHRPLETLRQCTKTWQVFSSETFSQMILISLGETWTSKTVHIFLGSRCDMYIFVSKWLSCIIMLLFCWGICMV